MKRAFMGMVVLGLVVAFAGFAIAEDEAKEMKGDAGCAKCCFKADMCAPAVKIGDTVYALVASEKACEATKKLIASFKGAAETTAVVIKGVIKENTVVADSVAKAKCCGN